MTYEDCVYIYLTLFLVFVVCFRTLMSLSTWWKSHRKNSGNSNQRNNQKCLQYFLN